MLKFLGRKPSERKLRLFACACCRRHRSALRGKNRLVLEAAEDFADGRVSRNDMEERRRHWYRFDYPFPLSGTWQMALSHATITTHSRTRAVEAATHAAEASDRPDHERRVQAHLVRDIFGNPFRPVSVAAAWLTWNAGTIPSMAQRIYDERALERLPVLADALEDAGCTNEDVLNHCRQPGVHARGCWVLDLLLARE
jgi:hypothetical protein